MSCGLSGTRARKVNAGGQHEPFNAYDLSSDPLAAKLFLQADLNQHKESDKLNVPFQLIVSSVSNAPQR